MHSALSLSLCLLLTAGLSSTLANADTPQTGIDGRWHYSDTTSTSSACTYAIQLNSDNSWEDVSNRKYRSGIYMVFGDLSSQSTANKKIVLSTTTDNFMLDCEDESYSSIGTSQMLELSPTNHELLLSNFSTLQKVHPIPFNKTLTEIDITADFGPLSLLAESSTTATLSSVPTETQSSTPPLSSDETAQTTSSTAVADINEPEVVNTVAGSDLPQSDTASDQNTPAISGSSVTVPAVIEPEPEAPFLGTLLEKDDWVITKSENVSFGNHSGDYGFVNSQTGDTESIRVTIKSNSNWGTGTYFVFPPGVEEAWVSFCVRIPENWSTSVSGKLPGFGGNTSAANGGQGGAPANGNNAWSARMMYGAYDSSTDSIPLGQYIYHSGQASVSNYGDPDWWSPLPNRLFSQAVRIPRSQWHSIKQRIRINTKQKNDGLIEAWVNDVKKYSRNDINFTNNNNFREIYKFWLDTYHGGSKNLGREQHIYYDQINYSLNSDHTRTNCGS